jgi:hypothetical protein
MRVERRDTPKVVKQQLFNQGSGQVETDVGQRRH